jgi:hypothetical protein
MPLNNFVNGVMIVSISSQSTERLNGMKSAGDVFRGVDEKTLLTYISFTK